MLGGPIIKATFLIKMPPQERHNYKHSNVKCTFVHVSSQTSINNNCGSLYMGVLPTYYTLESIV